MDNKSIVRWHIYSAYGVICMTLGFLHDPFEFKWLWSLICGIFIGLFPMVFEWIFCEKNTKGWTECRNKLPPEDEFVTVKEYINSQGTHIAKGSSDGNWWICENGTIFVMYGKDKWKSIKENKPQLQRIK